MKTTVDKHYVSDIDNYLAELRKQPKTPSQQKEFAQYQKIFQLRDNPNVDTSEN